MSETPQPLPDAIESELTRLLDGPEEGFWPGVARLCEQHPERARLIEAAARGAHGLMGEANTEPDAGGARRSLAELRAGDRVGSFTILDEVGHGGMGSVYLAEQRVPVRRRVALKVIKLGMDTRAVLARFEAERQALAMMDHSCIAKVYEAGATAQGRPYFAMEYVKGVPITRYCDEHKLSLDERLALFRQICSGVQHAHTKGVIHRDLTPNNVLVTLQDGKPATKIIDFGLARATDHKLTEKTLFTEQGVVLGTPEYMSPEQAGLDALDIDMRSDVYTLGVLLYELLTGALPFESSVLRAAGYDAMCKTIREQDPPRPSTKVTQTSGGSSGAATLRSTDAGTLMQRLRSDLDWVVLKCLEKDRTRRYETVSELAADIQRHLDHEPVLARAPSATYRLAKFARRHRGNLVAGASVLVVLVLGLVGTTVFMLRAQDSERRALQNASDADRERQEARAQAAEARRQAEIAAASAHDAAVSAQVNDARNRAFDRRGREAVESALAARALERSPRTLGVLHEAMSRLLERAELRGLPVGSTAYVCQVAQDGGHLAVRLSDSCVYACPLDPPGRAPLPVVELATAGSTWLSPLELVTAHRDGTVRCTQVHGRSVWEARLDGASAFSVDVQRGGAGLVAVGSAARRIELFDGDTGKRLRSLTISSEPRAHAAVVQVAFVPGREAVIALARPMDDDAPTGPAFVHVVPLDGGEGRQVRRLFGYRHLLTAFDCGWLTVMSTSSEEFWLGGLDGETVATFGERVPGSEEGIAAPRPEHRFPASCFAMSPDGTHLALGSAATVHIFRLPGLEPVRTLAQSARVNNLAFTPDGAAICVAGSDGSVRRWHVASGQTQDESVRFDAEINWIRYTSRGDLLAGGTDGVLRVLRPARQGWARYQTATGMVQLHVAWLQDKLLTSIRQESGGRHLLRDERGDVLWERTGARMAVRQQPDGGVAAMCFEAGVFSTSDLDTRAEQARSPEFPNPGRLNVPAVAGMDVQAGGRRAVVVRQDWGQVRSEVVVLERSGQQWTASATRSDFDTVVEHATFLPDGRLLLPCRDGSLRLVTRDLEEESKIVEGAASLGYVAVSGDGNLALATGDDGGGQLVDLRTRAVRVLRHDLRLTTAEFARDGSVVATADAGGNVSLWTTADASLVCAFRAHEDRVLRMAFSQDGTSLATGSSDGTVCVWPVDPARADAAAEAQRPVRAMFIAPR